MGFSGPSLPALVPPHHLVSPGCIFAPVNPVWDARIYYERSPFRPTGRQFSARLVNHLIIIPIGNSVLLEEMAFGDGFHDGAVSLLSCNEIEETRMN
jgi:hypothetical protein